MRDKAALVIVDDVWRAEDVEPFLAESRRSRLLLTTRDASIAAAVGAYWSHVSNLLRGADLARIKAQFPGYPHADLLRALQVSADALETALSQLVTRPAKRRERWHPTPRSSARLRSRAMPGSGGARFDSRCGAAIVERD